MCRLPARLPPIDRWDKAETVRADHDCAAASCAVRSRGYAVPSESCRTNSWTAEPVTSGGFPTETNCFIVRAP